MYSSTITEPVQKDIQNEESEQENEKKNDFLNNFACKKCGKNLQIDPDLEKQNIQFPCKYLHCESCDTVQIDHMSKRIPLQTNLVKANQINFMESASESLKEGEYISNDFESSNENIFDEDKQSQKLSKKKSSKLEDSNIKIYKCQECLKLFNKYLDLCHHLKLIHKKQGKYKCSICDEDFNTNDSLQCHLSLHSSEDKVICKGCKKTFSSLKLYYIHAKQNPGMHCFICRLCLRKFSTELMLDQHVCICQNGEPLHCACGKEFTKYKDVINHSRGTKPFVCCTCPHVSNSLTAYIRHLRKHSKQKPYQCTKCDMKFAVIDFLNIHNKKVHKDNGGEILKEQNSDSNPKQLIPDLSMKIANTHNEIQEISNKLSQQKNELQDERVQCPDCGKLLKKNRLDIHRNTHKTSASLCPECGKLFDTRFKLTQHIITAHNNEPVKCEICTKVLKTKKILNEHMKTHLKSELGGRIPQAICPMCGLGLAQKGSLARHILLTHEKHKIVPCNKTYTCQECFEILPNRAKYYSHRRMHKAMIDRFPCGVCGREFNKKQNLKRHIYLLHDETRVLTDPIFKCQFCTRCFREKKNLKRHYKMVHKVDDIV